MLIKLLRSGNATGGRVGLRRGTPNGGISTLDVEEEFISPEYLQQEEGVPIGPMAGGSGGDSYEDYLNFLKTMKELGIDSGMSFEDFKEEVKFQSWNPPKYTQGGRIGAFGGGVMGGRVGLKVLRDLYDDDEEEYAQGGRIGYDAGVGPVGSLAMNEESVPQMWLSDEAGALPKIDGGVLPGDLGNLTINDFDNIEDYMRYLRMINQDSIYNENFLNKMRNFNIDIHSQPSSISDIAGSIPQPAGKAQGGRIGAFGGGVMGIGVPGMRLPGIPRMAPDGIEFDMRAGGFQNLGAQEGKDDVNAKLAKNEFVMTADAVRGAGGGNIEVGAQRMYDTMKQLEGKVV